MAIVLARRRAKNGGGSDSEDGGGGEGEEDQNDQEEGRNPMAKKFEGYSGVFACVVVLVYIASIAAIVVEAQIMPKSIQQTLSPADSK